MNDQQILEFIATRQPVRAVQLSDKFDVDLKTASEALKGLVDVGDLVRTSGTAPNGTPAQIYSLSTTFLKSRDGQLLIARMEAAQTEQAAPVPVQAPAPVASVPSLAPVPEALPTEPAQQAKAEPASTITTINRTELGVAYIKKHGSVSDADLRAEMGLRAGQYPSAWLGGAIKRGEVNKDGKEWRVGPGIEIKKQPAFGGGILLPGSTPHPAPTESQIASPAIPDAGATPKEEAPAASKPVDLEKLIATGTIDASMLTAGTVFHPVRQAPAFRCGLWSDGVLELQRDGVTVAELNQGEGAQVAAFMARLRQPLETA